MRKPSGWKLPPKISKGSAAVQQDCSPSEAEEIEDHIAKRATEIERERCARIAEAYGDKFLCVLDTARRIAADIRNRPAL